MAQEAVARRLYALEQAICPRGPAPSLQKPAFFVFKKDESLEGTFLRVLALYREKGKDAEDMFAFLFGKGREVEAQEVANLFRKFPTPELQANFAISLMLIHECTQSTMCVAKAARTSLSISGENASWDETALFGRHLAKLAWELYRSERAGRVHEVLDFVSEVFELPEMKRYAWTNIRSLFRIYLRIGDADVFSCALWAAAIVADFTGRHIPPGFEKNPTKIFLNFLLESGNIDTKRPRVELIEDISLAVAFTAIHWPGNLPGLLDLVEAGNVDKLLETADSVLPPRPRAHAAVKT